jgi:2-methylcitrate dehydratase PrpD
VIHPVIDACRTLREQHSLTADLIDRIDVRVHPLVLELTGKRTPQTGLEGKFSVFHAAAVAILRGAAGPREFTDEVVRDPRVVALRDRVHATIDASLTEEQAHVTIQQKNGGRLQRFVEHAVGSRRNPMTDSDLEQKFRGQAEGILTRPQVDRLIELCWSIESLADAGQIARAAAVR